VPVLCPSGLVVYTTAYLHGLFGFAYGYEPAVSYGVGVGGGSVGVVANDFGNLANSLNMPRSWV
jgi:hypothetical protein